MATLLDLSLFSFFGSVFTFILVWIIVYALLEKTKAFGAEKKGLNGMVAVSVAVLVLASKFALGFVNFIVPWFLILVVVVFLIIFVFRVFGAEDSSIMGAIPKARMWVITISVIILLFGFGSVFGQSALEQGLGNSTSTNNNGNSDVSTDNSVDVNEGQSTDTGSFTTNLYNTLFHPKVLGLLFLLIVGILALVFLTER